MSKATELTNKGCSTSESEDVENEGHNRLLETCLQFFDSSSDSESDNDIEMVECLVRSREMLSIQINMMKECKMFFEKESRNCVKRYFEDVIPSYTDEEFKKHFRISKDMYKHLSVKFKDSEIYNSQRSDKRLSEELYMAVFLWFACSYRDIADRFDLALGTVWNMIHRVSFYISSLSPSIIKWPDDEKKIAASNYFS